MNINEENESKWNRWKWIKRMDVSEENKFIRRKCIWKYEYERIRWHEEKIYYGRERVRILTMFINKIIKS